MELVIPHRPKTRQVLPIDETAREEWLKAIEKLYADVTAWFCNQPGWIVTRDSDKEIQEERLGTYLVPVLKITSEDSEDEDEELILEPIARFPTRGKGVVEFYAFPTLYRVRLIGNADGSEWKVLTESGIFLHEEWNKENFLRLSKDLLGAG